LIAGADSLTAEITATAAADIVHDMLSLLVVQTPPKNPSRLTEEL
jgi:hypothetical protein